MKKENAGNVKKRQGYNVCAQKKAFRELAEWLKNIRKRKKEVEYGFLNNESPIGEKSVSDIWMCPAQKKSPS